MSGATHLAGFGDRDEGDPPDDGGCQLQQRVADPVETADIVVLLPRSSLMTPAVVPVEAGHRPW